MTQPGEVPLRFTDLGARPLENTSSCSAHHKPGRGWEPGGFRFYLGTHEPSWLERTGVRLFISARRLRARRRLPTPVGRWALDSGGFTELATYGRWQTPPGQYIDEVNRYRAEMPGLEWVAPQDWMCEPWIVARTGLSVDHHQHHTIASFLQLRHALGPVVIPVLQGYRPDDYLAHIDRYRSAGVDLQAEPLVGLGSICRRQAMGQVEQIVWSLQPLRLHGFGVKADGLRRYGRALASADSIAWSYHARRRPPLAGHRHKSCANCIDYAMAWRHRTLTPARPTLFSAPHPEPGDLAA